MFNRRKFLAGVLAGPAAALADPTSATPVSERKIWVIVGVNCFYNDEFSYAEGNYLTEHTFTDKATADETCARLIEEFCDQEDPDEFVMPDVVLPDGWNTWSRRQRWDWHLGLVPNPEVITDGTDDGYGPVATPFEVREMTIPASAVRQIEEGRERSLES
jgi:hypothetical protein